MFNRVPKSVEPRGPPVSDRAVPVVPVARVLQVASCDVESSAIPADYYKGPFVEITVVFVAGITQVDN